VGATPDSLTASLATLLDEQITHEDHLDRLERELGMLSQVSE
jgi:hypothetical protein